MLPPLHFGEHPCAYPKGSQHVFVVQTDPFGQSSAVEHACAPQKKLSVQVVFLATLPFLPKVWKQYAPPSGPQVPH